MNSFSNSDQNDFDQLAASNARIGNNIHNDLTETNRLIDSGFKSQSGILSTIKSGVEGVGRGIANIYNNNKEQFGVDTQEFSRRVAAMAGGPLGVAIRDVLSNSGINIGNIVKKTIGGVANMFHGHNSRLDDDIGNLEGINNKQLQLENAQLAESKKTNAILNNLKRLQEKQSDLESNITAINNRKNRLNSGSESGTNETALNNALLKSGQNALNGTSSTPSQVCDLLNQLLKSQEELKGYFTDPQGKSESGGIFGTLVKDIISMPFGFKYWFGGRYSRDIQRSNNPFETMVNALLKIYEWERIGIDLSRRQLNEIIKATGGQVQKETGHESGLTVAAKRYGNRIKEGAVKTFGNNKFGRGVGSLLSLPMSFLRFGDEDFNDSQYLKAYNIGAGIGRSRKSGFEGFKENITGGDEDLQRVLYSERNVRRFKDSVLGADIDNSQIRKRTFGITQQLNKEDEEKIKNLVKDKELQEYIVTLNSFKNNDEYTDKTLEEFLKNFKILAQSKISEYGLDGVHGNRVDINSSIFGSLFSDGIKSKEQLDDNGYKVKDIFNIDTRATDKDLEDYRKEQEAILSDKNRSKSERLNAYKNIINLERNNFSNDVVEDNDSLLKNIQKSVGYNNNLTLAEQIVLALESSKSGIAVRSIDGSGSFGDGSIKEFLEKNNENLERLAENADIDKSNSGKDGTKSLQEYLEEAAASNSKYLPYLEELYKHNKNEGKNSNEKEKKGILSSILDKISDFGTSGGLISKILMIAGGVKIISEILKKIYPNYVSDHPTQAVAAATNALGPNSKLNRAAHALDSVNRFTKENEQPQAIASGYSAAVGGKAFGTPGFIQGLVSDYFNIYSDSISKETGDSKAGRNARYSLAREEKYIVPGTVDIFGRKLQGIPQVAEKLKTNGLYKQAAGEISGSTAQKISGKLQEKGGYLLENINKNGNVQKIGAGSSAALKGVAGATLMNAAINEFKDNGLTVKGAAEGVLGGAALYSSAKDIHKLIKTPSTTKTLAQQGSAISKGARALGLAGEIYGLLQGGSETFNRWKEGDRAGAIVSGVGTLASTGLGLGALKASSAAASAASAAGAASWLGPASIIVGGATAIALGAMDLHKINKQNAGYENEEDYWDALGDLEYKKENDSYITKITTDKDLDDTEKVIKIGEHYRNWREKNHKGTLFQRGIAAIGDSEFKRECGEELKKYCEKFENDKIPYQLKRSLKYSLYWVTYKTWKDELVKENEKNNPSYKAEITAKGIEALSNKEWRNSDAYKYSIGSLGVDVDELKKKTDFSKEENFDLLLSAKLGYDEWKRRKELDKKRRENEKKRREKKQKGNQQASKNADKAQISNIKDTSKIEPVANKVGQNNVQKAQISNIKDTTSKIEPVVNKAQEIKQNLKTTKNKTIDKSKDEIKVEPVVNKVPDTSNIKPTISKQAISLDKLSYSDRMDADDALMWAESNGRSTASRFMPIAVRDWNLNMERMGTGEFGDRTGKWFSKLSEKDQEKFKLELAKYSKLGEDFNIKWSKEHPELGISTSDLIDHEKNQFKQNENYNIIETKIKELIESDPTLLEDLDVYSSDDNRVKDFWNKRKLLDEEMWSVFNADNPYKRRAIVQLIGESIYDADNKSKSKRWTKLSNTSKIEPVVNKVGQNNVQKAQISNIKDTKIEPVVDKVGQNNVQEAIIPFNDSLESKQTMMELGGVISDNIDKKDNEIVSIMENLLDNNKSKITNITSSNYTLDVEAGKFGNEQIIDGIKESAANIVSNNNTMMYKIAKGGNTNNTVNNITYNDPDYTYRVAEGSPARIRF